MSAKLDELKVQLAELSVDELLTLMERITVELRHKIIPNGKTPAKVVEPEPENKPYLPGTYRPTKEQIEASLAAMFTPEERAEAAKVDRTKLARPHRSVTEIINEDREDRF